MLAVFFQFCFQFCCSGLESLKVKLLLRGLMYGNIVCCVMFLLVPLHSLNFSNVGAGGNWCLLSSDSVKVFG